MTFSLNSIWTAGSSRKKQTSTECFYPHKNSSKRQKKALPMNFSVQKKILKCQLTKVLKMLKPSFHWYTLIIVLYVFCRDIKYLLLTVFVITTLKDKPGNILYFSLLSTNPMEMTKNNNEFIQLTSITVWFWVPQTSKNDENVTQPTFDNGSLQCNQLGQWYCTHCPAGVNNINSCLIKIYLPAVKLNHFYTGFGPSATVLSTHCWFWSLFGLVGKSNKNTEYHKP